MMKKVDSFVRLDILEEHKRSIMSILSDWEIKHLVEKENMIEPFVAKEIKEINGKKTLSYGLSSYGYDIRLSEEKCSLFGGTQTGMCDPKDFDFEILKSTTLNEDERGKYFLLPPFGYCLCRAEEKVI
jgi:dCTP deaminase